MQGTIPYLGTFLTDLVMLDTAMKDFLDVCTSSLSSPSSQSLVKGSLAPVCPVSHTAHPVSHTTSYIQHCPSTSVPRKWATLSLSYCHCSVSNPAELDRGGNNILLPAPY